MTQLLEVIKILNRNIRGRQETLAPLFVVGGLYDVANPFFLGRIKIEGNKNGYAVCKAPIEEAMMSTFLGHEVGESTLIGMAEGSFTNKEDFKETFKESVMSVDNVFKNIMQSVKAYYEV